MRKLLSLTIVVFLLLSTAGCGSTNADTATSSQIPELTLTPTSIPTPIPEPTMTLTPDHDMSAEMLMAPDIPDLTKQVQTQEDGLSKIVYKAAKDNMYALPENAYAGDFKKNVTVDGNETGGVALIAPVLEKILNQELDAIPPGEPRVKVILPVDITQSSNARVVVSSAEVFKESADQYIPGLNIYCYLELPIVWIVPDSEFTLIVPFEQDDWTYDVLCDFRNWQFSEDITEEDIDGSVLFLPKTLEDNRMTNDTLVNYLSIYVKYGAVSQFWNHQLGYVEAINPSKFEKRFGNYAYVDEDLARDNVVVICQETIGENYYPLTFDDILTIDGVPVFAKLWGAGT